MSPLSCMCQQNDFQTVHIYHSPPEGETPFKINKKYHREIKCCQACQHFISIEEILQDLYQEDYVDSTYGDDSGILKTFNHINALPPEKSDNVQRVKRIQEFVAQHQEVTENFNQLPTILDVGSGLCVFLHRMKEAGWQGTALDPDSRAVQHSKDNVGVEAICGDFMNLNELGRFDMITYNKVLEHVKDPVSMLAKSKQHLNEHGVVYVELPDGEIAFTEGPGREEFFIEHYHIFSFTSFTLLATRAGFWPLVLERIREPSTKYTLRAFLIPQNA